MLHKALLVVSDKFESFATRKDVITISALYNLLNANNISFTTLTKTRLIPGQGFSKKTLNEVLHMSKNSRNSNRFDFSMWYKIPIRASKALTHKHKDENILISDPQQSSFDTFSMNVLIDDQCEMMRDHQTGLHIQGVLLLEAARQGYLAIFEKFLSVKDQGKKYFIFNSMDVNYNSFAFPLPAQLNVKIVDKDLNSKKKNASMEMEIIQCGNVSASFTLNMTVVEDRKISIIETKLADKTLNEHINNILIMDQEPAEIAYV
jgi:hypothetical protein